MSDTLRIDYEVKNELDLTKVGLDRYTRHPSARIILAATQFNHGKRELWEVGHGNFPRHVKEALADPRVQKRAFNAQFEIEATEQILGVETPIESWRCTMALAYMQSFVGGLESIGEQIGLPPEKQKMKDGKRLIRMFCMPQKITKNQPHLWRDERTDPDDWQTFGQYCLQDLDESEIEKRLVKFPILESEWSLWHLDQIINRRGMPVDREFVRQAIVMASRRKSELTEMLRTVTDLDNPNSPAQLLQWVQKRGYPFDDLRKDTIKKVLAENKENPIMSGECVTALKLRQNAARTSIKKYDAILNRVGDDGNIRFLYQFGGASRTNRWAGRGGVNTQNLVRTPKEIESRLVTVRDCIVSGDYEFLEMIGTEPLSVLAGTIRSSFIPRPDEELVISDLSSIESRVIGWVSDCKRLQANFRLGIDPYKDFGVEFYGKPYDDITKDERNNCKPPVLGGGYRLGGGDLKEGKRTGLWGYAENMGVNITRDESHRMIDLFRNDLYPEIPKFWYALEEAVVRAFRTGKPVRCGKVVFERMKPYMTMILPSGRRMYYYQPRVTTEERISRSGRPYTKEVFSFMGKQQKTNQWVRLSAHGGVLVENLVQAIARDILAAGMMRAHEDGFYLIGHVHDELIASQKIGDNYYTHQRLSDHMTAANDNYEGLLLAAEGYNSPFYRKG